MSLFSTPSRHCSIISRKKKSQTKENEQSFCLIKKIQIMHGHRWLFTDWWCLLKYFSHWYDRRTDRKNIKKEVTVLVHRSGQMTHYGGKGRRWVISRWWYFSNVLYLGEVRKETGDKTSNFYIKDSFPLHCIKTSKTITIS